MDNPQHRTIRSYVLRQGRMTRGQAYALKNHWDDFGIKFSRKKINLEQSFQRNAPKVLDIGTGMGETLIKLAETHPENDYLAVEVHRPGIGSLIRNARDKNLKNIRVINHDVLEVLEQQLSDQSIDLVYIFFPDPWPKKRHHKRRLVSKVFLTLLKPCLRSGARIYLASDWEDLALHMLETCDDDRDLINMAGMGNFSPRPAWRPLTKFENRGLNLDHRVWDLCYCVKGSGYGVGTEG